MAITLIILEGAREFHIVVILVPFLSFAVSFVFNPETLIAGTADFSIIMQSSYAMSKTIRKVAEVGTSRNWQLTKAFGFVILPVHSKFHFSYLEQTAAIAHVILKFPMEIPTVSILDFTFTMVLAVLEFSEVAQIFALESAISMRPPPPVFGPLVDPRLESFCFQLDPLVKTHIFTVGIFYLNYLYN